MNMKTMLNPKVNQMTKKTDHFLHFAAGGSRRKMRYPTDNFADPNAKIPKPWIA